MAEPYDVVIIGAGLVGASLAAALAPADLRVAVVESHAPPPPADDSAWDSRIYTVSPGCAEFLASIDAWQTLSEARITCVDNMRVWGDDARAELDFSAYDAGLRELAFTAENGRMQHALWQRLQQLPHVSLICPAKAEAVTWHADRVELQLADGRTIAAKLLVGADGADSWVRAQAGIALHARDYRQLGVVANFSTAQPHRDTAFQWFRRDGVLALLPLAGNRVSMVWSAAEDHARELLALDPDALAARVGEACGEILGAMQIITPAAAFPLRLQRVAHFVQPRIALIGDAAHVVHPLAGQGVNLGLRDARELATVLQNRGPQRDCGDYLLLRRYARARREDIAAMAFATDALLKLFAADASWVAGLRNFGLRLVDHQQILKSLLIRHAAA